MTTLLCSFPSMVRKNNCFLLYSWLDPVQFSSVQLLSRVQLFVTPWNTARQASLSITNSQSLLKLMSVESVMPSSHLILCCPLLFLPPIPPSIRVFSNESTLRMRWPKYWTFSFSIIPSNEHQDWSPWEWTGWISCNCGSMYKHVCRLIWLLLHGWTFVPYSLMYTHSSCHLQMIARNRGRKLSTVFQNQYSSWHFNILFNKPS